MYTTVGNMDLNVKSSLYFLKFSELLNPSYHNIFSPGAPLTYFTEGGGGGVLGIFLGPKFLPKGIFWGLWKMQIFSGRGKSTGIFWGIVLFISSNQQ